MDSANRGTFYSVLSIAQKRDFPTEPNTSAANLTLKHETLRNTYVKYETKLSSYNLPFTRRVYHLMTFPRVLYKNKCCIITTFKF